MTMETLCFEDHAFLLLVNLVVARSSAVINNISCARQTDQFRILMDYRGDGRTKLSTNGVFSYQRNAMFVASSPRAEVSRRSPPNYGRVFHTHS